MLKELSIAAAVAHTQVLTSIDAVLCPLAFEHLFADIFVTTQLGVLEKILELTVIFMSPTPSSEMELIQFPSSLVTVGVPVFVIYALTSRTPPLADDSTLFIICGIGTF